MPLMSYMVYLILLHLIDATPQFNLYYTDAVRKGSVPLQHTCLRIVNRTRGWNKMNREKLIDGPETVITNHEITVYCMNEFTPEFRVEENTERGRRFTFEQLSKEFISSEQLYLWSAPIDLIERYQYYLNQLPTMHDVSSANEVFHNCTLPKFGPQCQYEFDHYYLSSLTELIHQYYTTNEYNPTSLTCYKHLQCYRGPSSTCLDWTEICNGQIDCTDGGLDEAHCWELEINRCTDSEYQCDNGQCIPKTFYHDDKSVFDCLDGSDETLRGRAIEHVCERSVPAFACEDRVCKGEPVTSSCLKKREYLLMTAMFSIKDHFTSDECWLAIKCVFDRLYSEEPSCYELSANISRLQSLLDTCPELLYIPNYPILFGDSYITAEKSHLKAMFVSNAFDLHICHNHQSHFDVSLKTTTDILFKNNTCFNGHRHVQLRFDIGDTPVQKYYKFKNQMHKGLKRYRLVWNYTSTACNRSNIYQCTNSSKCILIHRFFNAYPDCPYSDDEKMTTLVNNTHISEQLNKTHFYCQAANKYLSHSLLNDGNCDCKDFQVIRCVDENVGDEDSTRDVLFQTICNEFQELLPVIIEDRNETDETECEQWECHNIYTHCDGVWNCRNGADEIGCDEVARSMCSVNEHVCISVSSYRLSCLAIGKVRDGHLDCIGGTDEPRRIIHPPTPFTETTFAFTRIGHQFSCVNETPSPGLLPFMLCSGTAICKYGDDEKICETEQTRFEHRGICLRDNIRYGTYAEKMLCSYLDMHYTRSVIYFKLEQNKNIEKRISENVAVRKVSTTEIPPQLKFRCHRGLSLRARLNENDFDNAACLCPPSYYGEYCQYQNQRVSLVLEFRAFSDSWQTQFAIIVLLVDDSDDRIIHSYEQINYLSLRYCRTKFQIYLLYSTRPKDQARNYSIHVDIYEKKTLTHRGSLLLPILFSFLPVHRLAFIVDIPPTSNAKRQLCSSQSCNHGQCVQYSNDVTFCQCDQGWSGRFCTIPYTHQCSSDSVCIGRSADNRSICVCSSNKFGPRCLLHVNTICQGNNDAVCKHGGECIPNSPDAISNKEFACACLRGYSGDRCEIKDSELTLSFHEDIVVPQVAFVHFIRVMKNITHLRSTTFRSISILEDFITITWSQPVHIMFVELSNKTYYLVFVHKAYTPSRKIARMITSSDRCPYITELLSERFVQWHLRRIKYYHRLCQNQSLNVSCFHDDVQFCLCYQFGQKRLANCLTFDHNITFNCEGQNGCENGAQCFQDQSECPTRSICMCPACFFGQRCHLTTNGLGLSLDVILGYRILPYKSITRQPFIIKLSLTITVIFIIAGLLNGLLSLITFMNKTLCEAGCGLYLLVSSSTTLCTTIMFGLKFFILLLSHMSTISDQTFLSGQCYSFDFILRVFLSMDQWLNACVAIDRTLTVMKGTSFDKKKSKRTAQVVMPVLFIIIVMSYAHDPFHRKLIDEINDDDSRQNRIWCIVSYSPSVEVYNSCIHTFHVIGPFVINLVSVIILILKKSRQKSNLHSKLSYKALLRKTIKEHKHLLTAPVVLVSFGVPRIILIFLSKCMKSAGDAWLLLIGYFISFIPSMLLFLIFVLPSTFYKQTFRKTTDRYLTHVRRWFGWIE